MKKSIPVYVFSIFSLIYFLSIVWVNFHSNQWFGMDMLTYSYEGRLMSEGHTFFPEGWIFGNQYHIVSSPNLSSLFYPLFGDSTKSMAFASTLNTLFIVLSFVWCIGRSIGPIGLSAGVLCLIGGTIFGTDAAKYISGYQVLYTMSSYYSCYLIGILLSLGCWLRLRRGEKAPWLMLAAVFALNFALGMQSLREMLVLNIPLLALEVILDIFCSKSGTGFKTRILGNRSLRFAFLILLIEVAGHLFMKSLHVATTPIIGELDLDLSPSSLVANFWGSTKNILRVSGLAIAMDGLRYLPLSICALLVAVCVVWSLVQIVILKEESPLALAIMYSFLSVLCVYGVGIFFMRTRDIYYFVYWLLAALSVAYFFEHVGKKAIVPFSAVLAIVCAVNYGYNFFPDFSSYRKHHEQLEQFTSSLIDRGVEVVYVGGCYPLFAASSADKIVSQAFWIDLNVPDGYPFTVFPSDKHVDVFDDEHYAKSVICMGNTYLDYLETAPEEYRKILDEKLVFFDELWLGDAHYVLYKTNGRAIQPVQLP